jgi:hypothetical protein
MKRIPEIAAARTAAHQSDYKSPRTPAQALAFAINEFLESDDDPGVQISKREIAVLESLHHKLLDAITASEA